MNEVIANLSNESQTKLEKSAFLFFFLLRRIEATDCHLSPLRQACLKRLAGVFSLT